MTRATASSKANRRSDREHVAKLVGLSAKLCTLGCHARHCLMLPETVVLFAVLFALLCKCSQPADPYGSMVPSALSQTSHTTFLRHGFWVASVLGLKTDCEHAYMRTLSRCRRSRPQVLRVRVRE